MACGVVGHFDFFIGFVQIIQGDFRGLKSIFSLKSRTAQTRGLMWRSTIPPSAGTCYTMIIPLSTLKIVPDGKKTRLQFHAVVLQSPIISLYIRHKGGINVNGKQCLLLFATFEEIDAHKLWALA